MTSQKIEYTHAEMDPDRILPRRLHFWDTTVWNKDVYNNEASYNPQQIEELGSSLEKDNQ